MNEKNFESKILDIGDLFGSNSKMRFYLPSYQRPYAWTENETQQLFDDLYEAFDSDKDYFLGMLVLVQDSVDSLRHDVVDGQQRLITLTILYSVLRLKAQDDYKESCQEVLYERGNIAKKLAKSPRLFLRQVDQDFFRENIQDGEITALREHQVSTKTDSQKHIVENALLLLRLVEEKFEGNVEELHRFIGFITRKCYLIATVTSDVDSAIRIFSVMNNRGLNLQLSDIFKAELLEKKKKKKVRDDYAEKWESIEENEIGRSNLDVFLSQICTIFHPYNKNFTVLELLRRKVSAGRTPQEVVDKILTPYAEAYRCLKNSEYSSSSMADEVNHIISCLNFNFNEDWLPLAMQGLIKYKNDPSKLLTFLKKLDLLAAYLNVSKKNTGGRLKRYQETLMLMLNETNSDYEEIVESLELTPTETNELLEALDGNIYEGLSKDRRLTLLKRLDDLLSEEGSALYNKSRQLAYNRSTQLTIEHVLPQNPAKGSSWERDWTEDERLCWVHRLGNLVLLSRSKNAKASNWEFKKKIDEYFNPKGGVTTFALTITVGHEKEWTPQTVEKRQKELLETICAKWNIRRAPTSTNKEVVFFLNVASSSATGRYVDFATSKRFIVLEGSVLSFPPEIDDKWQKLRIELQDKGVVQNGRFVQDYEFSSPSAAAALIAGYSLSGPQYWKNASGRSIKELRDGADS